MKRKRLQQIGHMAWITVGLSIIAGSNFIPSPTLAVLLVTVGLAICIGEGAAAFRRKRRTARRMKWSAWVTYLAMLVCAAVFFGVAWKIAELWWVRMIWITTGIALCVPPPELAKR